MARLKRVSLIGVPEHVIQRGNNRQNCFASEEDMKAYLHWLKEYSKKYQVGIHAWVLMTNHVHLLCTPQKEEAISKMMQSVGRMYVRYFNYTYKRSGTLWEGRFKSGLIQSERYLLEVYRYIELNPVRANMVNDPSENRWSSYQCNGLGKTSDLLTPHPEYLALGSTIQERQVNYRDLFKAHTAKVMLEDIRDCINKGLALGNDRFTAEIEELTNKRVTAGVKGRPKKVQNEN